MLDTIPVRCPYCGSGFTASVDASAGAQRYVEDCPVCCRPIEVSLRVGDDGSLLGVDTATDRD